MIETKEKEIDGATYAVTQMTARKALRMKAKLMRIFGPSLAQLFLPSNDKAMDGMAFSKGEAVKSLQALAMQLDDDTFEKLIMEVLVGVRKNGMELNEQIIDLEFAGDLLSLFKVVWFVLEVNYASFFGESGIGILFQEAKPLKKASMKAE